MKNIEYVSRKTMDRYIAKYDRKIVRLRDQQRKLQKDLTEVILFLQAGPHGKAWEMYKQIGEHLDD